MESSQMVIAFLGLPGGMEWILILLLGLLLFGRRLPEVGRSLGQSVVEFRKGIKGIEEEIEGSSSESTPRSPQKIESSPATGTVLPNEQAAEPLKTTAPAEAVDERRVSKADEVE